jgi:lysozyme
MSLKTNAQKQLEQDEKRSRYLYHDTLNIPTIGIGRNLKRGLTEDEIDYLFNNDYRDHLKELLEAFPWAEHLDEARLGALLNMTFNMGITRLRGFKNMLASMEAGDWEAAASHALNSVWASQVGRRSHRIAEQIRSGQWQFQQ